MVKSLTGFGSFQGENNDIKVVVDLKSINSKFLDLNFSMPKNLFSAEYELTEILKKYIGKGKISVRITIEKKLNLNRLEINENELEYYYALLNKIKEITQIQEEVKLSHILSFKDIYNVDTNSECEEENLKLVKNIFEEAVKDLLKSKVNEGKRLGEDIKKRIKNIEKLFKEFEKLNKKAAEEKYAKAKERIKNLINNSSLNDDRLYLELAIIIDKSDITEELVRLKSHIKFFIETLKGKDELSKRLLFIVQEMQREANTISNKTESADILKNIVFIKEEIEKIKEQLANVE
jgi:uncharacterized protein (TIGR00255 family)